MYNKGGPAGESRGATVPASQSATAPPSSGWSRTDTAFAAIFALAVAVSVWLSLLPGYPADVGIFASWGADVGAHGVRKTYERVDVDYPPLLLYVYGGIGKIYGAIEDPTFDEKRAADSPFFQMAIKWVALVPHLLLALSIYGFWRGRVQGGIACLACALYALNPAALFDIGKWGHPNSVYGLFGLLGMMALYEGRVAIGWALLALAPMVKPHALPLLPVAGFYGLRWHGLSRTALGVGVWALIVAAFLYEPISSGAFADPVVSLYKRTLSDAYLSRWGHNLWFLLFGQQATKIRDWEPAIGGLSYNLVALALFAGVVALGCARVVRLGRSALIGSAAYVAFGWFAVTTRVHETYAYMALVLLAAAWPQERRLLVFLGLVSLTMFLNALLKDDDFEGLLVRTLGWEGILRAQVVNAGANVAIGLVWTLLLARDLLANIRTTPSLLTEPSRT